MNGYRKMMMAEGGNLSWCRPYISDDGKYAMAFGDNGITGMVYNGEHIPDITENAVRKFSKAVNPNYECYSPLWDDIHIALDGGIIKECNCYDCPWFDSCEAMDNPDDWDPDLYSGWYTDD